MQREVAPAVFVPGLLAPAARCQRTSVFSLPFFVPAVFVAEGLFLFSYQDNCNQGCKLLTSSKLDRRVCTVLLALFAL